MQNLKNKKILIVVPHQDDEINLAGNFLCEFSKSNNIYVAFTTNGDYIYTAEIRYKEAISSLENFGVKKENIYFFGYSDQPYDGKDHMYNMDDDWTSTNGIIKTYGIKNINEYCFKKNNVHKKLNKINLENDIENLIEEIMPDIILCNDLDFHPDHIMTSLLCEKALGKVIRKSNNSYNPYFLKSFTYENSYHGPNDYNQLNSKKMHIELDNVGNCVNNKYYNINEAINFDFSNIYNKPLVINPIFRSIKKHKSQNLISRTFCILNPNMLYWQRNTNNLLLGKCKIYTSSGNASYLNDFLLCDTSNVLNGNKQKICYDKGIWIPNENDNNPFIKIDFDESKYVDKIVLYNGLIADNTIKQIKIIINDEFEKKYELNNKYKNTIEIGKNIKSIIIQILDKKIENGFSEIEILSKHINFDFYLNEQVKLKKKNVINIVFNNIYLKANIFLEKVYRKIFIDTKYKNK